MRSATHATAPTTPPYSPENAGVTDGEIHQLFDARPQNEQKSAGVFRTAFSAISNAYVNAGKFITKILEKIGLRRQEVGIGNPLGKQEGVGKSREEINIEIPIGKPENIRKPSLPLELREAISEFEAQKRAADKDTAQQNFINENDMDAISVFIELEEDKYYFDQYLRLCTFNKIEAGVCLCPANFKEGAQRHAESLIKLVSAREKHANDNQQIFWLPADDRARLVAAQKFLNTHSSSNVDLLPVIPKNSLIQLLSFTEWQRWKKAPLKEEFVPQEPGLNIDAAVEYAKFLLEDHAGKDKAKNNKELSALLKDAAVLINEQDGCRAEFDNAWDYAELMSNIEPEVLAMKKNIQTGLFGSSVIYAEQGRKNLGLQMESFMAWQKWRADSNYLPVESDLSLEAAIQYAKFLTAQSEEKRQIILDSGKSIINDANDLVQNAERYKEGFNDACETANIRNLVNNQARQILENEPVIDKPESAQHGAQFTEPPSAVISTSPEQAKVNEPGVTLAPTSKSIDIPVTQETKTPDAVTGDAVLPPVSTPEVKPQPQSSNALPEPIPKLQDFDPRLQDIGTALLKEFFELYEKEPIHSKSNFAAADKFFSQLPASAADAYLERIYKGESVSLDYLKFMQPADRIVTEYRRRQKL